MQNRIQQGWVKTAIEAGVAEITFFHPAHNSLPAKVLRELTEAIRTAGENEEVQVIVLKSGGNRTFCAGASFDELISIRDLETGKQFFMGFANVINACRKCPKFIVGRLQGKAVGGGVGIAAAVDYCYATRYASVKLSELAIGIGPFVVGPAVERKLGTACFSQMAINATAWYQPNWAKANGLFAEVYESTEAMDEEIATFTKQLATFNPQAMQLLKKAFWRGCENWDTLLADRAAMSGELVLSKFTVDAINTFKAKLKNNEA